MIFVTVGNAKQPFHRLLDEIDKLAILGFFENEEVFVQHGHNKPLKSRQCLCMPFLSMDEFNNKIKQADIIISHGGAGSLINIIECGKCPIVVPRQREYGEHIDNHQLELAHALYEEGKIITLVDVDGLAEAIKSFQINKKKNKPRGNKKILTIISNAIQELT